MSTLIKSLKDFIGIHSGEKIIVCGCGTSLLGFEKIHSRWITIGVNDVSALFDPTYLVVTDHPGRFRNETRRKRVNSSGAKHLFTCTKGWRHRSIVYFELGSKAGNSLHSPNRVDHFINSPYVAIGIAARLGAKHIGLIGVDFTNGHFYNTEDGPHPVIQSNYLNKVNSAYQSLRASLQKNGISLYNLSDISRVELPKISFEEFDKL